MHQLRDGRYDSQKACSSRAKCCAAVHNRPVTRDSNGVAIKGETADFAWRILAERPALFVRASVKLDERYKKLKFRQTNAILSPRGGAACVGLCVGGNQYENRQKSVEHGSGAGDRCHIRGDADRLQREQNRHHHHPVSEL